MTRWNALLLTPVLMFGLSMAAAKQPDSPPTSSNNTGPHGGQIHAAGDFQCEVVFASRSVEVYVFDRAGQVVEARNVRGRVTFTLPGNPRTYRYDLYPNTADSRPVNGLFLAIDLLRVPDRVASVDIRLYGLTQRPVAFAAHFQRKPTLEQVAISQQRICPVSGKPLGSMGKAVKVRLGNQDVYVCCAGCTQALKTDPEVHLAKLTRHTLVKATPADAASIARQKVCPVMNEPLYSMGGPWKTTVQRRDVFLCCKGCLKILHKEPQKYLAKLPDPLPAKATRAAAISKRRIVR